MGGRGIYFFSSKTVLCACRHLSAADFLADLIVPVGLHAYFVQLSLRCGLNSDQNFNSLAYPSEVHQFRFCFKLAPPSHRHCRAVDGREGQWNFLQLDRTMCMSAYARSRHFCRFNCPCVDFVHICVHVSLRCDLNSDQNFNSFSYVFCSSSISATV